MKLQPCIFCGETIEYHFDQRKCYDPGTPDVHRCNKEFRKHKVSGWQDMDKEEKEPFKELLFKRKQAEAAKQQPATQPKKDITRGGLLQY